MLLDAALAFDDDLDRRVIRRSGQPGCRLNLQGLCFPVQPIAYRRRFDAGNFGKLGSRISNQFEHVAGSFYQRFHIGEPKAGTLRDTLTL